MGAVGGLVPRLRYTLKRSAIAVIEEEDGWGEGKREYAECKIPEQKVLLHTRLKIGHNWDPVMSHEYPVRDNRGQVERSRLQAAQEQGSDGM